MRGKISKLSIARGGPTRDWKLSAIGEAGTDRAGVGVVEDRKGCACAAKSPTMMNRTAMNIR